MNRIVRTAAASLVTTLAFGLSACGNAELSKTSGLLDDVKHVAGKPAVPAQTHTETGTKTETYCTSRKNGVCKSWGTRTVPTTRTVVDKPSKPAVPALWCVELDDVKGDKDEDDRWFKVSADTYGALVHKNEGAKITDMEYLRELPSCKR